MDLKGSLVDTHLRIYPSDKFLRFLETIPVTNDVPENILKLSNKDKELKRKAKDADKKFVIQLNTEDIENLAKIKNAIRKIKANKPQVENINDSETVSKEQHKVEDSEIDKESQVKEGLYLSVSDMEWLYIYLQKRKTNGDKDIPYLHVLLEGAHIKTPENEKLKRNPELEARCVKLRAQQELREYRQMTRTVDNVRMRFPEDSISYQLKQVNRQLIAIGQFIISIFAGFLFGFKGVEWMIGPLDFGFKLLLGVMCALVIALAEIYFLAKKLNEELSIPVTTQLGGPPKFADTKTYLNNSAPSKVNNSKVHED